MKSISRIYNINASDTPEEDELEPFLKIILVGGIAATALLIYGPAGFMAWDQLNDTSTVTSH